jgi:hypothetical protein
MDPINILDLILQDELLRQTMVYYLVIMITILLLICSIIWILEELLGCVFVVAILKLGLPEVNLGPLCILLADSCWSAWPKM